MQDMGRPESGIWGSGTGTLNFTTTGNYSVTIVHAVELQESHDLHMIEEVLSTLSISIVFIFAAEIVCLLFGMGLNFFTEPFYVFDMVIIGLTLALHYLFPDEAEVTYLTFTRVWRFVRIIHGVYSAEHNSNHKELEEAIKEQNMQYQKAFHGALRAQLPDLFDAYDLDHDGVVTADEYVRGKYDLDHDGVVTADEFTQGHDLDNDGIVTEEELQKGIETAAMEFSGADVNKDNALTREEFHLRFGEASRRSV